MTDEHLNHYANIYTLGRLHAYGITLEHYLANTQMYDHIATQAARYEAGRLNARGVDLQDYLLDPARYDGVDLEPEPLLPRQRVAAGKAALEMAVRSFADSLGRSLADAQAALDACKVAALRWPAAPAQIEYVTIEPPVWCHACGAMLAYRGTLAGSTVAAECPECEARSEAAMLRRTAPASGTLRGMP